MTTLPILFLSFIISFLLAGLIIWLGRMVMFMIPMLYGPVFVPSGDDDLATMLRLAQLKPGMKVADFGSGNGKIVAAVAQRGVQIDGFEINPLLVRQSRQLIKRLGLTEKATIYRRNFWSVDTKKYDVIMLYGTSYIMKKLEQKLQAELKPGSKVISNYFQFPTWKPTRVQGRIFAYTQTKQD